MWFSVALPLSFFMCVCLCVRYVLYEGVRGVGVRVCVCVVFDEAGMGVCELSTRGTFFIHGFLFDGIGFCFEC